MTSPPTDVVPVSGALDAWTDVEARVLENDRLPGKRHHYAVVELPGTSPVPRAGQFYMLAPVPLPSGLVLRRPMSVARAWRERGALRLGFLYTVCGGGTRALAECYDRWRVLGPLGTPFPDCAGPPILVGGGRGIAPLVLFAEECAARGKSVALLNGARQAEELVSPAELGAALPAETLVLEATEDGSRGRAGRVLDLLEDPRLIGRRREAGAAFYGCGPHGLLEAIGAAARETGVPAWVALEAHMACGVRICRTCVVPRAGAAPEGAANRDYVLACYEGPVVDATTIDWARAR
jgi:dihydroorotate dehydrogenase electron transfer subunit